MTKKSSKSSKKTKVEDDRKIAQPGGEQLGARPVTDPPADGPVKPADSPYAG